MNSEANRLRTLFHVNTLKVYDKNFITKKGFYLDGSTKLKCYICEEVIRLNQPLKKHMYLIAAHHCDRRSIEKRANVDIPSPYYGLNPNDVTNDLNYEEFRYATFANWMSQKSLVNRTTLQLAQAGFFYAAVPNTIRCVYCNTVIFADSCEVTCASGAIKKHDKNPQCKHNKYVLHICKKIEGNYNANLTSRHPNYDIMNVAFII